MKNDHYTQGKIECIDVLEQLAEDGEDFRILNAIKYLWRYRHKGGDEDLLKAMNYIHRKLYGKWMDKTTKCQSCKTFLVEDSNGKYCPGCEDSFLEKQPEIYGWQHDNK